MPRIIVTGGMGFMGSHLVDSLIDRGHEVLVIDNLSTGYRANRNPKALNKEFDLLDKETISLMVHAFKPQYVYHLAAWAHEGLSQFCPVKITENNYNATLNILLPSINVGVKRFIFTSSMSVYGEQEPPFSEDYTRSPHDIYAVAKTASEQAIELLSQVHGFDYTILRPHNVYGERQNISDPYRNVVGIFMRRILENKPLVIYGDGKQTRSFSYIQDVNLAIVRALIEPRASRQIINIGPTESYSINELAREVCAVAGKQNHPIEHIEDRPLEVKHAYCTNDKAQDILKYETTVHLREGLTRMFAWAKHLSQTTGIREPRYLDSLEILGEGTPKTWVHKSL